MERDTFGVSIKAPERVGDMLGEKVIEPIRVSRQVISSATDAAAMILRIDDVIASRKSAGTAAGPGRHARMD